MLVLKLKFDALAQRQAWFGFECAVFVFVFLPKKKRVFDLIYVKSVYLFLLDLKKLLK